MEVNRSDVEGERGAVSNLCRYNVPCILPVNGIHDEGYVDFMGCELGQRRKAEHAVLIADGIQRAIDMVALVTAGAEANVLGHGSVVKGVN